MSLMGSLYVGVSGLQAHQNALNTTAHNMSNVDSPGFVRQQVLLGTRNYTTLATRVSGISNYQIGMGVDYTKVRQVRHEILDNTYRREAGRSGFYEVSESALFQIQDLLGEIGLESDVNAFSATLDKLREAAQEIAKTPNERVNKALLVQTSYQLLTKAQAVYKGLTDYQDNLNDQIEECVSKINQKGKRIQELNKKICKIEAGGIESANDFRDERNKLLDELGAMVNMNYRFDSTGAAVIQIEGETFLDGDRFNEIGLNKEPVTGFYTAFWPHNAKYTVNSNGSKNYSMDGALVFDLTKPISADANTDIGRLKSLLTARGDHRANYTDTTMSSEQYKKEIAPSIIMNMQAQFDKLMNIIATGMNKVISDAANPATGYLCDKVGGSPIQIFQKMSSDGYVLNQITGNYDYVPENNAKPTILTDSLYTLTNLQVNKKLLQDPDILSFKKDDDSYDMETAGKFAALFDEEIHTMNPTLPDKKNIMTFYNDLVNQVGNTGSQLSNLINYQDNVVNNLENARQQIMGVSSEEELANMVKFQNAYNAASRYINVVDEMLEHLITSLA